MLSITLSDMERESLTSDCIWLIWILGESHAVLIYELFHPLGSTILENDLIYVIKADSQN